MISSFDFGQRRIIFFFCQIYIEFYSSFDYNNVAVNYNSLKRRIKMGIRRIGIWVFLIFLLGFLLATTQPPKRGGTLTIGIPGGIKSLSPWDSNYNIRNKILSNIFEPLIQSERRTTKIVPWLAVRWEVEKGNRVFTMKLRSGVKFHNGALMTVDDVVASAKVFPFTIRRVEKVDSNTVRFVLNEPASNFPYSIAYVYFAIAPSSSVNEYQRLRRANNLSLFQPVGSGPFKLSRWSKGKEIVLSAFQDYWGGPPYLDRIIYRIIPDDKERVSALERGDIDLIDIVFPKDLERLKKNPDLVMESTYGLNVCYLVMNTKKKPFSDVRVRRAINLAIDKSTLARKFVYGGYGIPTNNLLSPAFFGFPSTPGVGRYDPQGAKKLLAEAGYPNGFSAKFLVIPVARPYLPDPQGCAEEIKRELALVGIKVKIVIPKDYAELIRLAGERGDFDLCLTGWVSETGDPDYLLSSLLGGPKLGGNPAGSISGWRSSVFEEKLLLSRRLPLSDVMGRMKLYNEALRIAKEEVPIIPLFHTKVFVVYRKKVKGVIPHPTSIIRFDRVWIAQ